jgi:hypothetical protein
VVSLRKKLKKNRKKNRKKTRKDRTGQKKTERIEKKSARIHIIRLDRGAFIAQHKKKKKKKKRRQKLDRGAFERARHSGTQSFSVCSRGKKKEEEKRNSIEELLRGEEASQ